MFGALVKINLELSPDRQQFANVFFGFTVKAKQPSPCELGCLLIVVSVSPELSGFDGFSNPCRPCRPVALEEFFPSQESP